MLTTYLVLEEFSNLCLLSLSLFLSFFSFSFSSSFSSFFSSCFSLFGRLISSHYLLPSFFFFFELRIESTALPLLGKHSICPSVKVCVLYMYVVV